MKCPDCGATMQVGGSCPKCGYSASAPSKGKKPAPPMKKGAPPSKSKAPAKKKGSVPPQFLKKTGY